MTVSGAPASGPVQPPGEEQTDYRRKALAVGLELAKNAVRARTLDELQFVLVNDVRSLLPFDRSFLIVHFGGKSALVATNNQPKLEKKSEFVQRADRLATKLKDVQKALVLFPGAPPKEDLAEAVAAEIKDYMDYSKCASLIIVPLSVYDHTVAHLVLEFFGENSPGQVETFTLMNMVPFFSAALAEKWVLAKDSRVRNSFLAAISVQETEKQRARARLKLKVLVIAPILVIIALCFPMTLTVGGRAEVSPDYEYFAFVQIDGIVDSVLVKEGDEVKKDQVLAQLDAKEIDYKIREQQRLLESYRTEMEILRNLGAENPMKLAESRLVAIKSLRAKQDMDFLNWQRQYLTVRSPVDGVVLTKRVESLVGKKFKAGDPFCKIAPHEMVVAEIFVKESDVSFVQKNQVGEVFFNYRPDQAFQIRVKEIAPKSETMERVGSIFRVRADFVGQQPSLKPGMQGIAHIDTTKASLWFVLTRRIRAKINEALLYF